LLAKRDRRSKPRIDFTVLRNIGLFSFLSDSEGSI